MHKSNPENIAPKKILYIEDEAILAMDTSRKLKGSNFDVKHVLSGEAALELIEQGEQFDLVISDIDLGEGRLDGPKTAEQILKTRDIPVIFLTGHSGKEYVDKVKKITRYGYLLKNSGDFVLKSSIDMAFELFEANQKLTKEFTERNLAEEKIREKDIQFRKLSIHVADLIFQFTRRPDGTYYVPIASEGIKNVFGCLPEDVLDDFSPIARVIFPDDSARVIRDIEYSATHLSEFICEFRVQIPGKPIQWNYSRSTPEKLADGSITWYGFSADITERKKTEDKINQTQLLLRSSIESPQDMIILSIDKQYNYLYFNEFHKNVMETAYGKNVEIGMNLLESMTNEADIKKAKLNYDRALNGESHITIQEYGDLDRYYYETRYNPIFNEKNEVIGATAFSANVTERMKIEKALQESEMRLKDFVDSMGEWAWEVDRKGIYTYSSSKSKNYLGYSPNEIIGKGPVDFMPKEEAERIMQIFTEAAAKKAPIKDLENLNIDRNGNKVWLLTNGVPILDDRGELTGYRGVDKDITNRKISEEKINALLEEKETLLLEVHHRVKNTMNTMISLLGLQAQGQPEIVKIALEDAEKRFQGMSGLYEKMYKVREYTSIQAKEYIKELVEKIVEYFPRKKKLQMDLSKISNIAVNSRLAIPLGLIVTEFLTNIMKYAFPEDREFNPTPLLRVALEKGNDGQVTLTVADNGVGLPKDIDLNKPSGLGLTLIQALVRQLKGEIKIPDNSGKGTEFVITFRAEG